MWRWNCFVFGAGRGAGERRIDRLYEVKVCIGQGGGVESCRLYR